MAFGIAFSEPTIMLHVSLQLQDMHDQCSNAGLLSSMQILKESQNLHVIQLEVGTAVNVKVQKKYATLSGAIVM